MNFNKTNRLMVSASPWITIGISFVLMVIILFQTIMMYNREKEHVGNHLKEKGAVFIKSFETDVKAGMLSNQAALQRLVERTASHPDISYLFLVGVSGKILAHNNQKMIGTQRDDTARESRVTQPGNSGWQIVKKENSTRYFEVYKPLALTFPGVAENRPVMFIGMDVRPFEQAVNEDLQHNIVMIAIVFLVGLAGIISLFWSRKVIRSRRLLQDTRAFAAETIASLPMGIIIVDKRRHIRYMNDTACSLLGINISGITDKIASKVLPEEIWHLHTIAGANGKNLEKEIVVDSEKSGPTPISVMVTNIFGQAGDFIGFLFILKDLSQIRALELKIRRKERLAALGTLASGIAHEVRNPLSSIKGYAGFFGSLFEAGSDNRKAAQLMVEEIDRVDRVISELLEFARPADLQLHPTQPDLLIKNSLRIIRHEAESAGIRVTEKIDAPLPELHLDQDRFSQVLLNLYINAIQSMKHGGDLTVDVSVKEDAVLFAVSDTGEGISPDDQAAVFNPYYTTKKKGTGLGLAIAHKIIEGHNGTIWFESIKGKGTTFFVSIPLKKQQRKLP
ncbi:MAG: PAS domain-containing protein [Desulfotignum sp.]|nr:PAS domain-containing protein [Desulfotignum sp.]MCF8114666.1 PAS domain-containing protein [Desulfotignum sp.]